jgi:hypothetical protein
VKQKLMSWFDISRDNHARHPDIMHGFVKTFTKPIDVYADARAVVVGQVITLATDGRELFGEVKWANGKPNGCVHMNWHFGPGAAVGLSDGFMSPYAHRSEHEEWGEDDEENPPSSDPRAAQRIEVAT